MGGERSIAKTSADLNFEETRVNCEARKIEDLCDMATVVVETVIKKGCE